MATKRRKRRLVPRLGPAVNLRPAGAHESKKLYDRKRIKAALRREEDGAVFHYVAVRGGPASA